MEVRSRAIESFWERINQVTLDHIMDAKKLVWANSELDRGFEREEPFTPNELNRDYNGLSEFERVEIAYIDDEAVGQFDKDFADEISVLHSDLNQEYMLLWECCREGYILSLKE